jgi:hypothetical protein
MAAMNPAQREGRRPFAPRFAANFAPVSSGPSTRRGLVTFVFLSNAVFYLIAAFVQFANLLFRFVELSRPLWMQLVSLVVVSALAVFSLIVGLDFKRGRRRALYLGVPFLSFYLVRAVWGPDPNSFETFLSLALLIALISAQDELTNAPAV